MYQCVWIVILILLRTRRVDAAGGVTYGNLYSDLLDYVVFAVLIFYVLTIAGIFVLRSKRPDRGAPVSSFWLSVCAGSVYCGGIRDHVGAAAVQDANGVAGAGDRVAGGSGVLAVVADSSRKLA